MYFPKNVVVAAAVVALLLLTSPIESYGQKGRGKGRGGRWNDPTFLKDRQTFHFLVLHRKSIRRTVKKLPKGVKTITESDVPKVAMKIQEHVTSMYQRVKKRDPIRMRDPLFAAIFRNSDKIKMKVTKTPKGVVVIETSEEPYVVQLIQTHAEVVSLFLKNGYPEVRRNHATPKK